MLSGHLLLLYVFQPMRTIQESLGKFKTMLSCILNLNCAKTLSIEVIFSSNLNILTFKALLYIWWVTHKYLRSRSVDSDREPDHYKKWGSLYLCSVAVDEHYHHAQKPDVKKQHLIEFSVLSRLQSWLLNQKYLNINS